MEAKQKILRFFSRIWKSLIGLEPCQAIDSLSEKELDEFYERLGYDALALNLVCLVILWLTSTTVGHGMFDTLIAISFGFEIFFLLFKIFWPEYKTKEDFHDEVVNAKFYMKGNRGFLSYAGKDYPLEDFEISDGELYGLNYVLRSDFENKKKTEEMIFYVNEKDIFIKRIYWTWFSDQLPSYRVVSWIFFAVSLIGLASMVVGAILIAF